MNGEPVSVTELLALDGENADATAAVRSSEGMEKVVGDIAPLVPPGAKSLISGVVDRILPEMLNFPIADVLAHGWNKLRPVFKYRDRQKYPPNEVYLVSIADPEISVTCHPSLDVLMGEKVVYRPEFDLKLTLGFDTAVLRIQDGRINQIQAGSCKGKGTLSFKKAILFERATREFKMRGTIDLHPGLEIG